MPRCLCAEEQLLSPGSSVPTEQKISGLDVLDGTFAILGEVKQMAALKIQLQNEQDARVYATSTSPAPTVDGDVVDTALTTLVAADLPSRVNNSVVQRVAVTGHTLA